MHRLRKTLLHVIQLGTGDCLRQNNIWYLLDAIVDNLRIDKGREVNGDDYKIDRFVFLQASIKLLARKKRINFRCYQPIKDMT